MGLEYDGLQHAIRLLPTQRMLHVHRRLRLHREADQTQQQEESGVGIFLACRLSRRGIRAATAQLRASKAASFSLRRRRIVRQSTATFGGEQGLIGSSIGRSLVWRSSHDFVVLLFRFLRVSSAALNLRQVVPVDGDRLAHQFNVRPQDGGWFGGS